MTLSGAQHKQIQDALLAAFNEADLRQLVKFELDADLDVIAGGKDLEERTFNLVEWADQNGRTWELIEGACRANKGNSTLQELRAAAESWHMEAPEAGEPPYQGLQYFDVKDADRFFGREKLTAELIGYLRANRLLAVIGASGSGKSSVVRAGVVPALGSDEPLADGSMPPSGSDCWLVRIVTPTAHPLETLATALVPRGARLTAITDLIDDMGSDPRCLHLYNRQLLADDDEHDHLLLVVDQFEELFTLCRDKDEQRHFVDNLLAAATPDGVTSVILTLRADFYAHCAEFANLRSALESNQRYIGAMTDEELLAAIAKPAKLGDWLLEPGLANQMLKDVADEPGALPLLSHALLETWKRRSRRTMTFVGYYAAGGVQGAIAHTADSVYGGLTASEQVIARNIFLRLTELGEGVQDTRRRVPLQELISRTDEAKTVEGVLQKLQDQRLVTTVREEVRQSGGDADTEPTAEEPVIYVDVTHEALIREWPALKEWLAEDREGLRLHRKLTRDAQEWEALKRDPGALYQGLRLEQALVWTGGHGDDLNDMERTFLAESQERVEAAKREQERIEQEREEAQRRALTRTRWALGAALVALILAGAVSLFLFRQYRDYRAVRLFREAQAARDARDVDLAIQKFQAVATAYPTLGIEVAREISETRRYAAIQLIYEGEELAAEGDHAGAAEKFQAALDLEPPSDTPVYVWIPEGEFLMGSSDDDPDASDNEKPQHTVQLDGYWILRTEVTNEQYKRCVEAETCTPPYNERWHRSEYAREPVTDVDWFTANEYAAWVGGRLPTEAEWERACRDATTSMYPWGNDAPDPSRLNFSKSGLNGVVPVGSYPSGANGLYDMAGNVWEWTADWYNSDYYANSPNENPQGPESGDYRTLRGGSWYYGARVVRCTFRDNFRPDDWVDLSGFRVVSPGF